MHQPDGPRRTESQELTAVIPRDKLPPISTRMLASMDLDPDHPETQELMQRAQDDDPEPVTLVPCPAGCRLCPCCSAGMVAVEKANEWRQRTAKLPKVKLPDDAA
jgi:hypothetical protein